MSNQKSSKIVDGISAQARASADCLVVALGASAGGLEAFQAFLNRMPGDSGVSLVLVQHLDPHHESLMPELLAKHTAMPVKRLEDGMPLVPNHVYVSPANAWVTVEGCHIRVRPPGDSRRNPIDDFFSSLAREQGENSVGIVLSGTGSDGTLGLQAIKREGGLAVVQSPDTAKYDGMPRSAVASGVADRVVPVNQMPDVIVEYSRHWDRLRAQPHGEQFQKDAVRMLGEIFPLLRRETGHDFSRYKESTLLRRVQRRMQVTYAPTFREYVRLLRHSEKEVEELFKDLLIGVTQFFRDPEAFEALAEKVLPEIFRERPPGTPVRIWVPGCATGEEAYSLAVLLADYIARHQLEQPVQIFGTDIDEAALEHARRGLYSPAVLEQVPLEIWKRYFVRRDKGVEITGAVREMCVFSSQNLIKDPPFSHLDLISCRNVLIYLEADLQKKLLPLFHYALGPSGFVFLGPSENLAARSELFRVIEKKHRIFQRRPAVLRVPVQMPVLDPASRLQLAAPPAGAVLKEQTLVRAIERVLLDELAPAGMVVNKEGDVLYFSGPVGDYLQPSSGMPSNRALNLVRKSLRLELRVSLHKAASIGQPVLKEGLGVRVGRELRHINLIVRPLIEAAKEELFLVAFQTLPASEPGRRGQKTRAAVSEPAEPLAFQQLESELQATRDELQNTIEELEASNGELRSANEELLSMNEELQSTNEELQTSKEELQSLNDELQKKMEELDLAHNDLQNLVESSQVPTLFLDKELKIRKFTPAMAKLAGLQEKHVGVSLFLAAPVLAIPDLEQAALQAMETLQTQERELRVDDRPEWFIARLMPYRTLEHVVLGVVITLNDVTELKRAQERRSELAAIVESSTDAILSIDRKGLIRAWNGGAQRMYGWSPEEIIGRSMSLIVPPEQRAELDDILTRVIQGHDVAPIETVRLTKSLQLLDVTVSYSAIRDAAGAVVGVSSIQRDIRERKQAELTARLLASIVASSDDAIVSKDLNGIITSWNKGAVRMFGYEPEEIIGKPVTTFIPPERHPEEGVILSRIRSGDRLEHYETVRMRKDGTLLDVSLTVSPIRDSQGRIIGASKIARDVTKQKRAERLLAEATERLARANDELETRVRQRTVELESSTTQLETLVYSIAHDLRAPLRSMQAFANMLIEDYGKNLEDTGQEYARRIMRSAESLDRLVLDLLEYAKVGKASVPTSTLALEPLWKAASEQNAELIARRQASIETVGTLLPVRAEPVLLTQVLANLLNNALRFVPPERTPQIRLRTEPRGELVRLWVEDNGIGIDPRHIDRIFGLFQQLHGKKYGGTGVGLAIVQRAVESMGGRVGVESVLGQGSAFWLDFAQA